MKNYMTQDDLMKDFINECCEIHENFLVSAADLYHGYSDWHVKNISSRYPSALVFANQIRNYYPKHKIEGLFYYRGIKLKNPREKKEDDPGFLLAKQLMKQIDESGEHSGFWMVSALWKIRNASPQMNMVCLMNVIETEMPKQFKAFKEYLLHT